MKNLTSSLLTALVLCRSSASAQAPQDGGQVAVGIRVDTSAPPFRNIFLTWREYLQSGSGMYQPNANWSRADQDRWPFYNLTLPWTHLATPGLPPVRATIVAIDPVVPSSREEFVVRTLFTTVDTLTGATLPVALTRVYAIRENHRWVMANAFPRLTASWHTAKFGRITFVYPPEHRFNATRARQSARFVDSLAAAFDVPPPRSITFVVADRPEALARILGVDLALPGTSNGRSVTANLMILRGLPIYGEFYPHELTHLVLSPLTHQLGTSSLVDEGLAIDIGGSQGKLFPQLMRELDDILNANPTLRIADLLDPSRAQDSIANRAAAALIRLTFERAGTPGVKRVLAPVKTAAGPNHWLSAAQVLGLKSTELGAAVRAIVRRDAR